MIYIIEFCTLPMCILPWLLSGLLGLLAGYIIWNKWRKQFEEMEEKYNSMVKANTKLEADLKECNHLKAILEGDIATAHGMVKEMKAQVAQSEAALKASELKESKGKSDSGKDNKGKDIKGKGGAEKTNSGSKNLTSTNTSKSESESDLGGIVSGLTTGAASGSSITSSGSGKGKSGSESKSTKGAFSKFKENDLKIVEGIGPKIAELLNNAGINTWAELGDTTEGRIQEVLDAAGNRYKLAKPGSWPKQAGLAAKGLWAELTDLQDKLN